MSYTHTRVQFPRCTDVNYHGFHGTRRSKQADGEKRKKRGVTGSWRRAGSTSSSLPVFTVYRLDVSRWPSNVGRRADNLSVRLFWMFSDGGHMVAVHRRLNLRLFLSPPLSFSLSPSLSYTLFRASLFRWLFWKRKQSSPFWKKTSGRRVTIRRNGYTRCTLLDTSKGRGTRSEIVPTQHSTQFFTDTSVQSDLTWSIWSRNFESGRFRDNLFLTSLIIDNELRYLGTAPSISYFHAIVNAMLLLGRGINGGKWREVDNRETKSRVTCCASGRRVKF